MLRTRLRLREPQLATLFLLPAFLSLTVFMYYPIGQTAVFSLYDLNYTTRISIERFVRIGNYLEAFATGQFWRSFGYGPSEHGDTALVV